MPARNRTATYPSFAALGLIWLLGEPYVRQFYSSDVNAFWRSTRIVELSALERVQLQRGYYEHIVDVTRFNGNLWDIYSRRPKDWVGLAQTDAVVPVNDPRLFELRPNHRTQLNATVINTNRWGMRDRDYDSTKPPNTTRIAMLGASYVMGIGVNDDEVFDNLLETRLASDSVLRATGQRVEVLNFGVFAYLLQQQLAIMESGRLQQLGIDVVTIVGHDTDAYRGAVYLHRIVRRGLRVPLDTMRTLMRAAGWNAPPTEPEARRTMRRYEDQLTALTFQRMGTVCHANGWRCVYAYMPMPFERNDPKRQVQLVHIAAAGGLETIAMGDVYDGNDERKLIVAEWDYHPNARGHQIIAERFYREFANRPGLFSHRRESQTATSNAGGKSGSPP